MTDGSKTASKVPWGGGGKKDGSVAAPLSGGAEIRAIVAILGRLQ